MIKRNCQICGREFYAYLAWIKGGGSKFCSKRCVALSQRKRTQRKCEICGKIFGVKVCLIKRNRGRFCSKKCKDRWQSQKYRGKNHPNWKGYNNQKICPFCGKTFFIKNGQYKQKYCSRLCGCKAHPERIKNLIIHRGKKPRKRKVNKCLICGEIFEHWIGRKAKYCSKKCWSKRNPPIFNQCLYCGKEFWAWKCDNRKYCSRKCYGFHKRELLKGENSHFWKGGKTKLSKLERSKAEYDDWRNAVFQRDNYTCQICEIKSGQGHRIYLHAHHIKSYAENPELRFDVNNGITLCKNCHLLEHHHEF